jgi:hypothetical protein
MLLSTAQSTTIDCVYYNNADWGTFGTIYWCNVKNTLIITSLESAQIDSIIGDHLSGFSDDDVQALSINIKDQVNFFPKGIIKYFKNLKGIQIYSSNLKEIHKKDLKYFPKLVDIRLQIGQLEVLEENLFEFNPMLETVLFSNNKISHIDPHIFDNLEKLKTLHFIGNSCIDKDVSNNTIAVKEFIQTLSNMCTYSVYSELDQKVRNLVIESSNLNSEDFKQNIENLEDEIKNSKFSNFFQEKIQDLKVAQIKKEKEEFLEAISKLVNANSHEMCSAMESSFNEQLVTQNKKISAIEEKLENLGDKIEMINKNYEDLNRKFSNLMMALGNVFLGGFN